MFWNRYTRLNGTNLFVERDQGPHQGQGQERGQDSGPQPAAAVPEVLPL